MTVSGAGRSGTYYYHITNLYAVRAVTEATGDLIKKLPGYPHNEVTKGFSGRD